MKSTTGASKKELSRAVSLVSKAPSVKDFSYADYVGLRLEHGLILFRYTGEVEVMVQTPYAPVVSQGEFLVPVKPLAQFLGHAPGDTVDILVDEVAEGEGSRFCLVLSSGGFKTRLKALGHSPELLLWDTDWEEVKILPAKDLLRALEHVLYAVGKEDYLAVLRGVQLEFSDGGLRAVASDGYRLALYDVGPPAKAKRKVVITAQEAKEMVRLLKEAKGIETTATLFLRKDAVAMEVFTKDRLLAKVAARTLEGEFPDYEQVIPKEFPTRVVVEVKPFLEALKQANAWADKDNRVDIRFEEGRATLAVEEEHGWWREEVPVSLEGPPMEQAYNARYLLEALSPLSSQAVLLLSGPTSPSLVRPGEAAEGYQAVVVPLRV